ncbi:transglutaminase TgpA family protein [Pseudonocardia bannensis]|uniref:DUF4129 domain-containing protein n=1 Tax=Pseudonocardia bannensis TaxID=630973 RepID=A0A848DNH4_9PSEU|nr:transglutaminaseTgpA domain-containing protein [Pseudonocardia bannensis]NMH94258.1 DUF4129 domain-containing protein [Pseudonocardia bannensis]
MSAPAPPRPPASRPAPPAPQPGRRRVRWFAPLASGVAVLLCGAPVYSLVQGAGWLGHAVAVVALVVGVGLLLGRLHGALVAGAQSVAALGLLTALFTDAALLGVVPGPGAFAAFGDLLAGAGPQVGTGTPPVPGTPEILFLITGAFGLLAVVVYAVTVSARAPAAAGVPLLAVFAVPTALADQLLPWWVVAAGATGFGLLLLTREGARRQLPAGMVLTAVAVVLALLVGSAATAVGTSGRFGGGSGGTGGAIGLNPFTALRGQLTRADDTELFRVTGLPRPQYLRALTLRDFVPTSGWQAGAPGPGVPLTGPLPADADPPGEEVTVGIENVGFRDYWLPLYGTPLAVSELPEDTWAYDRRSGTAYTARPRREDGWQQRALLPAPTAEQLRAAPAGPDVDPAYLATEGVDPRVAALATEVTSASSSDFDRSLALVDWFTGPGSEFRYSLQTAPGSGDDALVEFLTVGRAGYCEQFASAMAIMLRTLGVPARVAVGFTAGTDTGEHRSVGTSDAHAWVEAFFSGYGWVPFDPTPLTDGRALVPPYVQQARDQAGGPDQLGAPDELASDRLPDGGTDAPAATPPVAEPQPGSPATPEGSGVPLVLPLMLVVALLAGLVPAGVRTFHRRHRLAAVAAGGPAAVRAGWEELLAESADRGVPATPSDTVRGAARRLVREHRLDDAAQDALREVVDTVEASWYGGRHPAAGELTAPVQAVRTGITAAGRRTLRETLLPRSVLDRMPLGRRRPPARTGHGSASPSG